MSHRLPRTIRTLIRDHVHSVGELDLLMLLQAQSDRTWTAEEICAALGAPVAWVTPRLDALQVAGFVAHEGDGWRTRPRTTAQRETLDTLAVLYRTRRRDLVQYVFAQKPGESARSGRRL
jgi:hypothetical protein